MVLNCWCGRAYACDHGDVGGLMNVGRVLGIVVLLLSAGCSDAERSSVDTTAVPSTTSRQASDQALMELAGCTDPCAVTGRIPVDHPAWGAIQIVTFSRGGGETDCDYDAVIAVDDTSDVVWSSGALAECGAYRFGPAGSFEFGSEIPQPVDAAGRVFLDWNPGRYNGVSVLVPTAEGFDDLGTLPTVDYGTRFYGSTVEDWDEDGVFEILLDVNSCHFGCAGGPSWTTTFTWTGEDFTPSPADVPTWCGYWAIYDEEHRLDRIAELRDITVMGTSCFSVLDSDQGLMTADEPLVGEIIRAHDRTDGSPTFEVEGWTCEVTNPRTEGARYLCSGDGMVSFTRHTEQILREFGYFDPES